jgi:hypothetical protein
MEKPIFTYLLIGLILNVVLISGCTFDDSPNLDPQKYGSIFMPQARNYPTELTFTLKHGAVFDTVFSATYGGPKRKNGDIPVKFSVAPALVDSFNIANGTSYPILPESTYKLSGTESVIRSGEQSSPRLKLKIDENELNQETKFQFLLPITLESGGGDIKVNKELQTTYYLVNVDFTNIDKSSWEILNTDATSSKYPASNAIDNDILDTFAYWSGTASPYHYFSVDMKERHTLHGFTLIGRGLPGQASYRLDQDPTKVKIQFSSDGVKWGDGEVFKLPINVQTKSVKVYLSNSVSVQYFKVSFLDTYNSNINKVNLAEIYAF